MTERVLVIETLDGTLRAPIAVPSRVIGLGELAALVMPIDDGLAQLADARVARQGKAISCRDGCAYCCRQLVPVSPAEAFHLAELVERMPEERRLELTERFARRSERLGKTWIGYALRERLAEVEPKATELAIFYHRLQIDCPFLEGERCSVYRDRPAICREYQVVTPKQACRFPGKAPIEEVAPAVRLSGALGRLSMRLLGTDVDRMPLLSALDYADAHADERARRWPAEELVELLIEELRQ